MDVINFMKEQDRMCQAQDNCADCPIRNMRAAGIVGEPCQEILKKYITIVEKWSERHPQKTILDDFLEKFPNARQDRNGRPIFCVSDLGYCEDCSYHYGASEAECDNCWNRPLSEVCDETDRCR